jgi:hypothetical protein
MQDVEIIIGAVIAAVAGLGAAWLTNLATLNAQREERKAAGEVERERWQREDALRREDLDRRRQERWLDEKRVAAAHALAAMEAYVAKSVGPLREDLIDAGLALNQAIAEVRLIAPEIKDEARTASRACSAYVIAVAERGRGVDPSTVALGEREAYQDALDAFVKAAIAMLAV